MNFNNPILICGSIAFGIVLLLIIVVVICCKKSNDKEREELKELSLEIESDFSDRLVETSTDDKIETVLSKMQEALEVKEENPISFEQEQEENAIISYQELLNSLGAKNSIDVDSIELYDDELDNQVEISDFNKEIINAYQNESLDREIYRFQNDYSSDALPQEVVSESPVMNFDFSSENFNFDKDNEEISFETVDDLYENRHGSAETYEVKHGAVSPSKRFKRTEFISPIYGVINENRKSFIMDDEIEKVDIVEDDSLIDEF